MSALPRLRLRFDPGEAAWFAANVLAALFAAYLIALALGLLPVPSISEDGVLLVFKAVGVVLLGALFVAAVLLALASFPVRRRRW